MSLLERARQKREELGLVGGKDPGVVEPIWDPAFIPDLPESTFRSDDDDDIDRLLSGVDVIEAYRRWCGKMEPNVGSRRESIMVSCPNPAHPDKNPSAWINADKDCGNCALCGGFDKFDIFAWNRAFNVPGYKTDGTFPALRRAMAEDMGWVTRRTPGGREYLAPIHGDDGDDEDDEAVPGFSEPPAPPRLSIVRAESRSEDAAGDGADVESIAAADPLANVPPIDWRSLLDEDSLFLRPWMELCSTDDLPEEFYFWLGLSALGLAVGNDVSLRDRLPVRPNLMLCLTGPSGMGKSRAYNALKDLMYHALPWGSGTAGVRPIANPGSAEALLDEFCIPIYDPTDPKVIIGYEPVKGLLYINELAGLTGKAQRAGNTTKQTLMELYDSPAPIDTTARGHGKAHAENHFCQVVSTTQPGVMKDLLTSGDALSGFVNRWMFVLGQTKKPVAIGGTPLDVRGVAAVLRGHRSWGALRRSITLTDDAEALWTRFFHTQVVPLKMSPDSASFARLDLLMKKLMLLMAVDKRATVVDVRTVEQVISLWSYIVFCFALVDATVGQTIEGEIVEMLRSAATKHNEMTGKAATFRDLQRRAGRRWNKYDLSAIMKTLSVMCASGDFEELVSKPETGRATVRYRIGG